MLVGLSRMTGSNSKIGNHSSYQAVLFDLDGTLIDTMPLHFRAYRDVLSDLGVSIDFDFFMSVSGGPARDTIPRLLGETWCEVPVSEIHRRKVARARQILQEEPVATLPCSLLLPLLSATFPVGLVSSGSRESVEAIISVLGWQSLFRVIVCGDDVSAGKPHPEGYLKAAGALGVSPGRCLVFEDMTDGVAAARAAGMQVFDLRQALPSWRATINYGAA